jgi:hypothetical protein
MPQSVLLLELDIPTHVVVLCLDLPQATRRQLGGPSHQVPSGRGLSEYHLEIIQD